MQAPHEFYIRRCFELAKRAGKHVKSNPQVGALLVYQNRIIGEGWHQVYGQAHAEVNAIQSVAEEDKQYITDSCLYVSLEPCNTTGKTGPCAELILKHKIQKLVFATNDPLIGGVSCAYLREKGIDVTTGVCKPEGDELIQAFIVNQSLNRPYVLVKFAQSKDHFMGKEGEQVWLSNEFSNVQVHKWRSEVDAIVIGVNTLLTDNPKLTTRLYPGESPIPVIIDPQLRSDPGFDIFQVHDQVIIFTSKKGPSFSGAKLHTIDFEANPLEEMLRILYVEYDICKLMVEGGRKTIQGFVNAQLWDEARVITAPITLGAGIKAPGIMGIRTHESFLEEDTLQIIHNPPA